MLLLFFWRFFSFVTLGFSECLSRMISLQRSITSGYVIIRGSDVDSGVTGVIE